MKTWTMIKWTICKFNFDFCVEFFKSLLVYSSYFIVFITLYKVDGKKNFFLSNHIIR